MTDSNYTHMVYVCDRTGSMGARTKDGSTRAKDATKGVRDMLAEQAAQPGTLSVSLYDFDTPAIGDHNKPEIRPVATFAPGLDEKLTGWSCQPRGNTPLLDAIGQVVTDEGAKLAGMAEENRPGKVIVVIATDGEENDSRDWDRDGIRELIARQEKDYGWKFLFIGAGPEAFAEARKAGFAAASSIQTDPDNIRQVYNTTSGNVAAYRGSGQSAALHYSGRQRADAMRGAQGKPHDATVTWQGDTDGEDETN